MVNPFNLLVGIVAICLSIAQLLAAFDKIELDQWPFVRTPSRALRIAAASWAFLLGAILLLSAFCSDV